MGGHLWFLYAFSTAILWGLSYVVIERVLKAGISAPMIMFIYTALAAPFFLIWLLQSGRLLPELNLVLGSKLLWFYSAIFVLAYIAGNLMIFKSVSLKNSTMTSLVEISYPIFTIIFSWLLFREFNLNLFSAIGGVMIFCGVILIYLKG